MVFSLKNLLELHSYIQLLQYGIHIGHSFKNTLFMNSWLVYNIRINLVILNLFKFLFHFKIAFEVIAFNIQFMNPIWFINLDPFYDKLVKFSALKCGEFFVCSNWIRGMISNFRFVCTSFRKLFLYSKLVFNRKDYLKQVNFNNWALTRFSWPRSIFISSVHNSYFAVRESLSLSIPSLGIVDSNTFTQSVIVGIPGNDETIECIMFYNDLVSTLVLRKKFKSVILWYLNVRRSLRLRSFKIYMQKSLNSFFKFVPNNYLILKRGFEFFYSWSNKSPSNVDDGLFFFQSNDLLFDVNLNHFFLYIKKKIIFWRSFSFLSYFWSGGRNFFNVKWYVADSYSFPGVIFNSNTISWNRSTFYFRKSVMIPKNRFFLVNNRYWTYQGISNRNFPSRKKIKKFFARKGLYWSLYMYFFLSESLSLYVLDSKFFKMRLWSKYLKRLSLLHTLGKSLNLPFSINYFNRQSIFSLLKISFKEHKKLNYIYSSLYKMIIYIKKNILNNNLFFFSLSVFFYKIWYNLKKKDLFKRLTSFFFTIKNFSNYFNLNLKNKACLFDLYASNKTGFSFKRILNLKGILNKFYLKYLLNLKLLTNFFFFSVKNLLNLNFLLKFIIFTYKMYKRILSISQFIFYFSKNKLNINISLYSIGKILFLKKKAFLYFLNKSFFLRKKRKKKLFFSLKKLYNLKYKFYLGRLTFSTKVDRQFLKNFSNWFIGRKINSLFILKLYKLI